jgi:hypothetical protein
MYVFHDGSGNIVGVTASKPATNYVEIDAELAALVKADVTAYTIVDGTVTLAQKAVFEEVSPVRYKDLLRASQAVFDVGEYRFGLSSEVGASLHLATMMIAAGCEGPFTLACLKGTELVAVQTDVAGVRSILHGLESAYLKTLK